MKKPSTSALLRWVLLTTFTAALPVLAAEPTGDFSLPTFAPPPPPPMPAPEPDAGVPLSAPPLPNTSAPVPAAVPTQKEPVKAEVVPRWSMMTLTAAVNGSVGRMLFFGGEGTMGGNVGRAPRRVEGDATRAEGWLGQVAVIGVGGSAQVPECGGRSLCAQRFGGGLGGRFGFATGAIDTADGTVRAQQYWFGELDVLGSYNVIKSAPLSPAREWGELVLRLRVGANLAPSSNKSSVLNLLTASVFFEAVPVSGLTPSIAGGGSVGLAL